MTHLLRGAALAALLLLAPWAASAQQPPPAECRWAPGVYTLGQPVELEVLLPVREADFFLTGLPKAGAEWGPARVREISQRPPAGAAGTLTVTLTVQPFTVGEMQLPAILVAVNTASGASPFEVSPPPLPVKATLEEGAAAPPPAQVLAFPEPFPWGWIIGGLLAVTALAAAGAWFLKKARVGPTLPPPPQVADPDAWIRAEVARLLAGGVEPAFRYGALSRALREYLQIKTELPFPDWTTAEIRRNLSQVRRLEGETGLGLLHTFALCDQVKFARHLPSPEEEAEVRPRVEAALAALRRPEPKAAGEAA